jgi:mono/diheme cytochrome c family protein
MLYRFNLVLGLLLASVFALLLLLRVDHSQPNYQVNLGDDMTYSPAYSSFSTNPNFANGRTMQAAVPGTIARGTQVYHFEATPEEAVRAGEQLANPFDPSTPEGIASAARGAVAFQTFCIACHGADGTGNGPVAKRGFPPPPSLLVGKSREMKDGQLLHILTYGQNSMPQFAAQLSPERRWDIINYIRTLQQATSPETLAPETAPPETASPETAPPETAPPETAPPETAPPETAPPKSNQITQPDSVAPARDDTETKP